MTLDEFRQQNADYKDWDDARLANGIYNKFYAQKMSREEFDAKVGYKPAATKPEQSGGGYLSTFAHGMVKGFSSAATAQGEAAAIEMSQPEMQGTMPTAEQATDIVQKEVTGPLPVMPGRVGKYVEAAGEVIGNPATYIGPGGLALKMGGGMLSAVGGEAAAQALEGTAAEKPARVIGSLLFGLGTGTGSMERQLSKLVDRLPDHSRIKEMASAFYKQLEKSNTKLSPEGAAALGHEIETYLEQTNHRRYIPAHGPVFSAVDELTGIGTAAARAEQKVAQRGEAQVAALSSESTPAEVAAAERAQAATAGKTTSVGEIDTVRKVLTGLLKSNDSATREAAHNAIDAIDSFLMNVPEKFIVSGNPKADAEMLRKAQQLWSTHKQMETVEQATTRAQRRAASTGTGYNRINAARQELRRIIDSEKLSRGMPQEVKDKIEQIVTGTWASNKLRYASKWAPSGPVSMGASVLAGLKLGDVWGVTLAISGLIAEHAGQYLTDRQIGQLEQMMRGGSVIGQPIQREISPLMDTARMTPAAQAARTLATGPLAAGGGP